MPRAGVFDDTYQKLLETENHIRLLEPFKGSKAHHKMQCMLCGYEWTATPLSKRQTLKKYGVSGCPACNDNRREERYSASRENNIEQLRARGIEILSDFYDGRRGYDNGKTYVKVKVRNVHCGHEFYCSPANLLANNVVCGVCGPTNRPLTAQASNKVKTDAWKKTATEWQLYKSIVTSLTAETYNKYKKQINPQNLKRGKAGVEGAYHLDHRVPKRFCFENNIPVEICAHQDNLQMVGWRENIGARDKIKGTIPPMFFKYVECGTRYEEYASTLKTILPDCQTFVNIADVVATAYDQQSNRAVVVLPIDETQANLKSASLTAKALTDAKIQYIILFEDELTDKQLLTAKLLHYTHRSEAIRIHARKCVIKECSKDEKKQLLESNHVQGNDDAQVMYGAYYDDKLVAVMTFCIPRIALGQKKKQPQGTWELSRFCTDVRYRIPGIASKLLKYFQRNNVWVEIYSYADKRWSVGNMYHQLGFDLVADNNPDYFYVVDGMRKHRWRYRKDMLKTLFSDYDSNLTEYQNMENHGYWRIWGCGTLKFSMRNIKG